jgi:dihydrofolate synthase/folylpolyglutamate synthase
MRVSSYNQAVRFLEQFWRKPGQKDYLADRKNPELYLKRTRYFLRLFGNPDKGIKFVHIGGTAGKGSVATALHNILTASGKRVGLFTSPFCTTSIEKISVNGTYISPREFVILVNYLKPYIKKAYKLGPHGGPSYFEIFFAMALLHFKRKNCHWAVLETGLGGKYDATNVIKRSAVSAITNVNFDHTELLGRTLKQIAQDKAGIIKSGTHFFTTEERPHVLKNFKKICQKKNVPMRVVKNQIRHPQYWRGIVRFRMDGIKTPFRSHLTGSHQFRNISLATAIAKHLKIPENAIREGIANTRLPCRFEIVQKNPLVVLDGAHNVAKMKSVAENLKYLDFRKVILVLAVAKDKDLKGILRVIAPLAEKIFATTFHKEERQCYEAEKIAIIAKKYKKRSTKIAVVENPNLALRKALKAARPQDLVLITGSFFLAGELRKFWYSEEFILKRLTSFD